MEHRWPARIAGTAAGLANGLFGGGGGMVFLPILSRWGGLSQRKLYATCVGVIFLSACSLPLCIFSGAVWRWLPRFPIWPGAFWAAGWAGCCTERSPPCGSGGSSPDFSFTRG